MEIIVWSFKKNIFHVSEDKNVIHFAWTDIKIADGVI